MGSLQFLTCTFCPLPHWVFSTEAKRGGWALQNLALLPADAPAFITYFVVSVLPAPLSPLIRTCIMSKSARQVHHSSMTLSPKPCTWASTDRKCQKMPENWRQLGKSRRKHWDEEAETGTLFLFAHSFSYFLTFWGCRESDLPSCKTGPAQKEGGEFGIDPIRWVLIQKPSIGGQNLYTNTVRRGPPHTPGRLFGVYVFPLFSLENKLFGIHQTSFFACWGTWILRAENTFGVYFFPSDSRYLKPLIGFSLLCLSVWLYGMIMYAAAATLGPAPSGTSACHRCPADRARTTATMSGKGDQKSRVVPTNQTTESPVCKLRGMSSKDTPFLVPLPRDFQVRSCLQSLRCVQ